MGSIHTVELPDWTWIRLMLAGWWDNCNRWCQDLWYVNIPWAYNEFSRLYDAEPLFRWLLYLFLFVVIVDVFCESCYWLCERSEKKVKKSPKQPRRRRSRQPEMSLTFSGLCELIFGPMFAGKTTELLRRLTTMADVGLSVLYINHSSDVRSTTGSAKHVTTHHSQFTSLSDKITTVSVRSLADVNVDDYDVIGIDEAQFFDYMMYEGDEILCSELEYYVREWMTEKNKIIYVGSLSADFQMKAFGHAHELVCLATNIVHLKAKCVHCLRDSYSKLIMVEAPYTWRTGESTKQVDVGAEDKYIAVCLGCYKKATEAKEESPEEEEVEEEEEESSEEEDRKSDEDYDPDDEDESSDEEEEDYSSDD